jgi:hypothetical protein
MAHRQDRYIKRIKRFGKIALQLDPLLVSKWFASRKTPICDECYCSRKTPIWDECYCSCSGLLRRKERLHPTITRYDTSTISAWYCGTWISNRDTSHILGNKPFLVGITSMVPAIQKTNSENENWQHWFVFNYAINCWDAWLVSSTKHWTKKHILFSNPECKRMDYVLTSVSDIAMYSEADVMSRRDVTQRWR